MSDNNELPEEEISYKTVGKAILQLILEIIKLLFHGVGVTTRIILILKQFLD